MKWKGTVSALGTRRSAARLSAEKVTQAISSQ
jgi:hypothetical protein